MGCRIETFYSPFFIETDTEKPFLRIERQLIAKKYALMKN